MFIHRKFLLLSYIVTNLKKCYAIVILSIVFIILNKYNMDGTNE